MILKTGVHTPHNVLGEFVLATINTLSPTRELKDGPETRIAPVPVSNDAVPNVTQSDSGAATVSVRWETLQIPTAPLLTHIISSLGTNLA